MESMDPDLLRETIRRTLARRAGERPDALALQLTTPAYPWLAAADEPRSIRVATFRARLETREPHTATSAVCAVLQTFVELLATLLGVGLVADLLDPVWEPHA